AIAHGLDVTLATIAPRAGDLGHVEVAMPSPEACGSAALPPGLTRAERLEWQGGLRAALSGCAQVYLAGLAAESILSELFESAVVLPPEHDPDYRGAHAYVAVWRERFGVRTPVRDLVRDLWVETKRLLRKGWDTVENLAQALLQNTTLK